MRPRAPLIHAVLFLLTGLLCLPASAATPEILVSIKPLHSLVSQLTDGISTPRLLLSGQQTAHRFQLRPSQKRMLKHADIFFYSSHSIETFVSTLKQDEPRLQFVELSKIEGLHTLTARRLHHHASHSSDNRHKQTIDGHIWLSIDNARQISRHVTTRLATMDPAHAPQYWQNLQQLLSRLDQLQKKLHAQLETVKDTPFLVYHDAFQYFETENKLSGAFFVTTSPDHRPGIKRLKELRQLIQDRAIRCIYYEPPGIPPLINTLADNMPIQLNPLDPAGTQFKAGKQHYFLLMQDISQSLYNCLSKE